MSGYSLRPHHALCIRFFEGKGYSEDFVHNMRSVIARLSADDPLLASAASADAICGACPNNNGGYCATEEKVRRYDMAVSELCGISADERLHWSELSALISDRIIAPGRLPEVCKDCCWFGICSPKASQKKK